jgi:hypothetical protein
VKFLGTSKLERKVRKQGPEAYHDVGGVQKRAKLYVENDIPSFKKQTEGIRTR